MTIDETVVALRAHLEQWYEVRKTQPHNGEKWPHNTNNNIQPIRPGELKVAVDEFMEKNPQCKQHEFDLHYDFVAKDGTYIPTNPCCGNDCCDVFSHVKVTGVVVERQDWDRLARAAQVA